MLPLKTGVTPDDPRLDRLRQFDERSRSSPVAEILEPKKLRSYTWNFRNYDPRLDQGSEGACVGFGWANELALAPVMVPNVTNQMARERIYWPAQKIDPWDGGAYPEAAPQYEGTSVLAGAKVVQKELGLITEYRWAFGLDDVLLTLGYLGPVVLGLDWYSGMMRPDSSGRIFPTGSVVGGHCLVARGISVKQKLVRLRNSWGPGWGKGGDCFLTFDDLGLLLAQQGEACVPLKRTLGG